MPKPITGVAIRNDITFMWAPPPNLHHSLLHSAPLGAPYEEGFVDEDGIFLTREEAMGRAISTNQLKRDPDPKHYQGPKLFSEDLW